MAATEPACETPATPMQVRLIWDAASAGGGACTLDAVAQRGAGSFLSHAGDLRGTRSRPAQHRGLVSHHALGLGTAAVNPEEESHCRSFYHRCERIRFKFQFPVSSFTLVLRFDERSKPETRTGNWNSKRRLESTGWTRSTWRSSRSIWRRSRPSDCASANRNAACAITSWRTATFPGGRSLSPSSPPKPAP